MSTTLRPYQAEIEKKVFDAWKAGDHSIMVQLITGGGKTVIFVEIIKKFLLARKRVMLVAHREELITQAWETLHRNKIYAGIIKSGIKPNYSLPCQVASIQTINKRKELPHADVIIFDEGHHCQDDNSYGTVTLDHFSRSRMLAVTATPYRLGGKGFRNMFNTLISGPSFKELVAQGWLMSLRYFIASRPDLHDVKVSGGDYVAEEARKAMEFAPLVESYKEHCNGMKGLVFAVNIQHSNHIVGQYNAAGIPAVHIDGDTPNEIRRAIIKKFKEGHYRVMSNVGIFTEGFDCPDTDFVQLARPTKSLSLFLQMVGRGTRPIWDVIKDCATAEERVAAIAASRKPYCYILDNASLFEEHGLPDQDFDWQRYFDGIPKRRKKMEDDIEVIEFVAEKEDGERVRTKQPAEIEGLKLVEVTHSIKERVVNITSLKEFDKGLEMFKRMSQAEGAHVKKPGFVAFQRYQDYCRKNNVAMTAEIWDYIYKKLNEEPELALSKILSAQDQDIHVVNQTYAHDEAERKHMIDVIKKKYQKSIDNIKKTIVPESYLRKEENNYRVAEELRRAKAAV